MGAEQLPTYSPLHRAARWYAARGLRVFPCQPRDKAPLTSDGFLAAVTDLDQIDAWWGQWPDANVGLNCAMNGLLVLDIDPRHGGASSWKTLLGDRDLPDTPMADTGGGGTHIAFRLPDWEVRHKLSDLPGIDVKERGYIIVAPSLHPSGGAYHWQTERRLGDLEPADVPEWLRAHLEAVPVVPIKRDDRPRPELQDGDDGRLTNAQIIARALDVIPADEYGLWIGIGKACHALGEPFETWDQWSATSGKYDFHQCEKRWDGFIGGDDAKVAIGYLVNRAREAQPGFLGPGYRAPERPARTDRGRDVQPETLDTAVAPVRAVQWWHEFRDWSPDEPDWLVTGLIPKGSFGFLAARPKEGKTWLAQHLAEAVAFGQPFLGRFDVPTPMPVMYVGLEGSAAALRARGGCLAHGLGLDPTLPDFGAGQLAMWYKPRGLDLGEQSWCDRLCEQADIMRAALIIIDVLRKAVPGLRESGEGAGDFAKLVQRLLPLTDNGRSLLFLHHFVKLSEGTRDRVAGELMSGSGALFGHADYLMCITKCNKVGVIKDVRLDIDGRDTASPEPFEVVFDGEGSGENGAFGFRDSLRLVAVDGADDTADVKAPASDLASYIMAQPDQRATRKQLREAFGIADGTLRARREGLEKYHVRYVSSGSQSYYQYTAEGPVAVSQPVALRPTAIGDDEGAVPPVAVSHCDPLRHTATHEGPPVAVSQSPIGGATHCDRGDGCDTTNVQPDDDDPFADDGPKIGR